MHIKKITTLIMTLALLGCANDSEPKPYVLSQTQTDECHQEIEATISELIEAKALKVSKDVFSKTSSLHLTNKKDGILKPSPIFNDLNGRKTLNLYKKENKLFIGLLNRDKEISKEKSLKSCQ